MLLSNEYWGCWTCTILERSKSTCDNNELMKYRATNGESNFILLVCRLYKYSILYIFNITLIRSYFSGMWNGWHYHFIGLAQNFRRAINAATLFAPHCSCAVFLKSKSHLKHWHGVGAFLVRLFLQSGEPKTMPIFGCSQHMCVCVCVCALKKRPTMGVIFKK